MQLGQLRVSHAQGIFWARALPRSIYIKEEFVIFFFCQLFCPSDSGDFQTQAAPPSRADPWGLQSGRPPKLWTLFLALSLVLRPPTAMADFEAVSDTEKVGRFYIWQVRRGQVCYYTSPPLLTRRGSLRIWEPIGKASLKAKASITGFLEVWPSVLHYVQEAMENFVFPYEIKTQLMKMSKFKNIFYVP